MSKEEELRALRELTQANRPANTANKVDDVSVMKWLDAHRRKSTDLEEVEIIDRIVQALFYEGINKITGRLHGTKLANEVAGSNSPDAVTLGDLPAGTSAKTDRKAYMRDLMRKRRQKEA